VVRQGAGTDESNAKWCHGSSKTDRELLSGDGEKIGPVGRGRKKWVKELALTAGVPLVTGIDSQKVTGDGELVRRKRLPGLLSYYHRRAA
jgi:hypothetical protein